MFFEEFHVSHGRCYEKKTPMKFCHSFAILGPMGGLGCSDVLALCSNGLLSLHLLCRAVPAGTGRPVVPQNESQTVPD